MSRLLYLNRFEFTVCTHPRLPTPVVGLQVTKMETESNMRISLKDKLEDLMNQIACQSAAILDEDSSSCV